MTGEFNMSALFYSVSKISNALGKCFLLLFVLAAAGESISAPSRDIAQTAVKFVRLFTSDRLSLDAAKELMGDSAKVVRHGEYWQISSKNSLEEIVLHAQGLAEYGDEAELRLRLESGLLLRDLEKAFGRWELVFASKTSSVSFQVVDQMNKPVVVFARLFTPNPLPDSQVLSVKVRRG